MRGLLVLLAFMTLSIDGHADPIDYDISLMYTSSKNKVTNADEGTVGTKLIFVDKDDRKGNKGELSLTLIQTDKGSPFGINFTLQQNLDNEYSIKFQNDFSKQKNILSFGIGLSGIAENSTTGDTSSVTSLHIIPLGYYTGHIMENDRDGVINTEGLFTGIDIEHNQYLKRDLEVILGITAGKIINVGGTDRDGDHFEGSSRYSKAEITLRQKLGEKWHLKAGAIYELTRGSVANSINAIDRLDSDEEDVTIMIGLSRSL